ncbi:MAG: DUF4131 domain-containing protein, partial [Gammaproteobacteria bacterium]|nr:DUF4131 domain-containing protein [Gammaproteobacteria bacterium]
MLALTAALGLLALRVPAARPAAAAALGFSWALAHAAAALDDRLDPALEGRDAVIEGEIMALPQRRERATRARLRVTRLELDGARVDAPGRVRLSWYGPRPPLAPGERWRL